MPVPLALPVGKAVNRCHIRPLPAMSGLSTANLGGILLDKQPLPVIRRLPHVYRWSSGTLRICDATDVASASDMIIFELLDRQGLQSQQMMLSLQEMLADIDTDSKVVEWLGGSCLLVSSADEATVNCCLKNNGVAITENFAQR